MVITSDTQVGFHAQAEDGAWILVLMPRPAPANLLGYLPARGLIELAYRPPGDPTTTLDVSVETDLGRGYLESSLGLFAAAHLRKEVAIHAALVRAGSQLVLMPGASLSGKTSMCVAARSAGCQVLADEYVLVDPSSGVMSAWARPMRIRELGSWRREPLDLELSDVAPTLVALLKFDAAYAADGAALAVRTLTEGELAVELISNTLCAQLRPQDALAVAMLIASRTPGVKGSRGEADLALRDLLALEL